MLLAIFPGILSAALLTLAFPKTGWWWLAWVALAPWYSRLSVIAPPTPLQSRKKVIRSRLLTGFAFGLALHLIGMFWMTEIGAVPYVILSIIEAGWFAFMALVAGGLLHRLPAGARPWVFAALWTLLEWVRSWGSCAFPWFLLAATQTREIALPFVQVTELTGQWGLSFAVATVNALVVEGWRTASRGGGKTAAATVPLATAAALIGLLYGGGLLRLASLTPEKIQQGAITRTVALVQGNVQKPVRYDQRERWEALQTYLRLTREVAAASAGAPQKPTFILWPETVVPGHLLRDPELESIVSALAREVNTPLLVGTPDADFFTRQRWNTTVYLDAQGRVRARYDKVHLVPMGEFFLFRNALGSIYEKYHVPNEDFTPGTLPGVFPVGGYGADTRTDIGMLICYESVFPGISRDRVRKGAKLLVQMTSDQTFDGTPNPQQHADLAVLRAVETRRWFVRAGATGLSEMIDPAGRVREKIPEGVAGTRIGAVTLREGETLFVRWGDWFVALCAVGIMGLALPVAWWYPRRRRPANASSPAPESPTDR